MKNAILSFVVGFLFAIGLGLSGMTRPEKVVGFLDIFGNWDPSLMFVMMGAIGVHFVAYRLILKKQRPLYAPSFQLPTKSELTPSLMIGAVLFGMGWGLAGYCPGPAVTSLASLDLRPLIFVVSMIVGFFGFKAFDSFVRPKR